MNTNDLVTILGNLSQSLYPVQRLITGGAYLLGIFFVIKAIGKFRKAAEHKQSRETIFGPVMYLVFGSTLIFLPTALNVMANTAFGTGNVLSYTNYNPTDIYSSMGLLIRTAGLLWFVRGCVLVVHASEPGTQHGPKGLVFLISGVLAMNFDNTIEIVNYVLTGLVNLTVAVKNSQGF